MTSVRTSLRPSSRDHGESGLWTFAPVAACQPQPALKRRCFVEEPRRWPSGQSCDGEDTVQVAEVAPRLSLSVSSAEEAAAGRRLQG